MNQIQTILQDREPPKRPRKKGLLVYPPPEELPKIIAGQKKLFWSQGTYLNAAIRIFNRIVNEKTADEIMRLAK